MKSISGVIRSRRVLATFAILTAVFCGTTALPSEPIKKSGYALGPNRCGIGTLSFPKIQIDMKKGFCAGLVASEEDDLRFPRSIVQIPGREQFVISDMGGWQRTDGRLLLLLTGQSIVQRRHWRLSVVRHLLCPPARRCLLENFRMTILLCLSKLMK